MRPQSELHLEVTPRAESGDSRRTSRRRVKIGSGFLSLNTRPWTEVYLRSQKLGVTPLPRVKLPAGRHKLRLVNRPAGIDTLLEVRIRPGKLSRMVKDLRR